MSDRRAVSIRCSGGESSLSRREADRCRSHAEATPWATQAGKSQYTIPLCSWSWVLDYFYNICVAQHVHMRASCACIVFVIVWPGVGDADGRGAQRGLEGVYSTSGRRGRRSPLKHVEHAHRSQESLADVKKKPCTFSRLWPHGDRQFNAASGVRDPLFCCCQYMAHT